MTKIKTRPISVTISVALWSRVKKLSKELGIPMYELVPSLLETGLRRVTRGRVSKKTNGKVKKGAK